MEFVLLLIDWEWQDRAKLALQTLDMGFQFTQAHMQTVWCLLASPSPEYRRDIITVLQKRLGLCHPVHIMEERATPAPHDLATFVLFLRGLDFSAHAIFFTGCQWFLDFRKTLGLDLWLHDEIIILLLCIQSGFGIHATHGVTRTLSRNVSEKFLARQGKPFIVRAEEAVIDLLMHVSLRSTGGGDR